MNRGDPRDRFFKDDDDRRRFLSTPGEACAQTQWQVQPYGLMRNHFHWVSEMPQANLAAGMKWLLGVYSRRFRFGTPRERRREGEADGS